MKLFYRKYGEGPPIVILHGLFGSSDNWVTIAKNISKTYTVYLPDLRNHGKSPHSDTHDYEAMCTDLFELVTDLGLKKFYLAGHSMGGKTAILFSLKWPEMINGLLIADISPFNSKNRGQASINEYLTILEGIIDTDILKATTRTEIESLLSQKISSERVREFIMKNLQRTESNLFKWKLNAPALKNNLQKIIDGIPCPHDSLAPITGFPVIILKGENSDYISADEAEDMIKIFPSADLRIVPGAGHWLHADNPEAVIEAFFDLADH